MPSWGTVLDNLNNTPNPMDAMRRKYLGIMHKYTGRNIIAYYSAFVHNHGLTGQELTITTKTHLCKRFVA